MNVVSFRDGPLGSAVLLNGRVVGSIKNRTPYGWVLKIEGHKFPVAPGSVADWAGQKEVDGALFKTKKAAMSKAIELLKG